MKNISAHAGLYYQKHKSVLALWHLCCEFLVVNLDLNEMKLDIKWRGFAPVITDERI